MSFTDDEKKSDRIDSPKTEASRDLSESQNQYVGHAHVELVEDQETQAEIDWDMPPVYELVGTSSNMETRVVTQRK